MKRANIWMIVGGLLVISSIGALLHMQMNLGKIEEQRSVYVESIQQGMPEVYDAFLEERSDAAMPVAEVEGENFVGLLEVPAYGVKLPVGSSWDVKKVEEFPCRYWGSIYDGSLIIGGTDSEAQLDFWEKISIGDVVCFTDVTGARYSFTVSWVERTEDVSTEYLEASEAKITLFARNSLGFDYIVVRCE